MNPEQQQQRIMAYFIEEAKEHLQTIEQGVLNLQDVLNEPEMVNDIFRAAHSIKGGAAMLGVASVQHIAHRFEDYFKILQDNNNLEVDEKLKSLLLAGFDRLQELVDYLQVNFKISDELATTSIASVEPVFTELEVHLNGLVAKIDPSTVTKSTTRVLSTVFQSDINNKLRDMLQLFKQADSSYTRQQLQDICHELRQTGEEFDLTNWCELIQAAANAISFQGNSYSTLAPVLIKEIKQAKDLVLEFRSEEITISDQLHALLPETEELTDRFDRLLQDKILDDIASVDEDDDVSEIMMAVSDSQDEAILLDEQGELTDEALFGDADDHLAWMEEQESDQNLEGPEVGASELKSLASLFENEDIDVDLALAWEDIESAETLISSSAGQSLQEQDEFADLFTDESSGSENTAALISSFTSLSDNDEFADFFESSGSEVENTLPSPDSDDYLFSALTLDHEIEPEVGESIDDRLDFLTDATSESDLLNFEDITLDSSALDSILEPDLAEQDVDASEWDLSELDIEEIAATSPSDLGVDFTVSNSDWSTEFDAESTNSIEAVISDDRPAQDSQDQLVDFSEFDLETSLESSESIDTDVFGESNVLQMEDVDSFTEDLDILSSEDLISLDPDLLGSDSEALIESSSEEFISQETSLEFGELSQPQDMESDPFAVSEAEIIGELEQDLDRDIDPFGDNLEIDAWTEAPIQDQQELPESQFNEILEDDDPFYTEPSSEALDVIDIEESTRDEAIFFVDFTEDEAQASIESVSHEEFSADFVVPSIDGSDLNIEEFTEEELIPSIDDSDFSDLSSETVESISYPFFVDSDIDDAQLDLSLLEDPEIISLTDPLELESFEPEGFEIGSTKDITELARPTESLQEPITAISDLEFSEQDVSEDEIQSIADEIDTGDDISVDRESIDLMPVVEVATRSEDEELQFEDDIQLDLSSDRESSIYDSALDSAEFGEELEVFEAFEPLASNDLEDLFEMSEIDAEFEFEDNSQTSSTSIEAPDANWSETTSASTSEMSSQPNIITEELLVAELSEDSDQIPAMPIDADSIDPPSPEISDRILEISGTDEIIQNELAMEELDDSDLADFFTDSAQVDEFVNSDSFELIDTIPTEPIDLTERAIESLNEESDRDLSEIVIPDSPAELLVSEQVDTADLEIDHSDTTSSPGIDDLGLTDFFEAEQDMPESFIEEIIEDEFEDHLGEDVGELLPFDFAEPFGETSDPQSSVDLFAESIEQADSTVPPIETDPTRDQILDPFEIDSLDINIDDADSDVTTESDDNWELTSFFAGDDDTALVVESDIEIIDDADSDVTTESDDNWELTSFFAGDDDTALVVESDIEIIGGEEDLEEFFTTPEPSELELTEAISADKFSSSLEFAEFTESSEPTGDQTLEINDPSDDFGSIPTQTEISEDEISDRFFTESDLAPTAEITETVDNPFGLDELGDPTDVVIEEVSEIQPFSADTTIDNLVDFFDGDDELADMSAAGSDWDLSDITPEIDPEIEPITTSELDSGSESAEISSSDLSEELINELTSDDEVLDRLFSGSSDLSDSQFESLAITDFGEISDDLDFAEPSDEQLEAQLADRSTGGQAEFDELDAMLNDSSSSESPDADNTNAVLSLAAASIATTLAAPASELTTETQDSSFDELDALLGDDTPLPTPTNSPKVFEAKVVDEFADLDIFLQETYGKDASPVTARPAKRPPGKRPSTKIVSQTMKVDVKHLDSLNNLVGELVVNRNLLEQDQERLQQFISNLLHQVQLLSDVSQRMRDQYDRSLLENSLLASRNQTSYRLSTTDENVDSSNSSSGGEEFDPLQMDRFSSFHVLSQEIIELIVRVRESASDIEFVVSETEQVSRQLGTITTQIQDDLKQSRMVPFAQIADRLPRAVRDLALEEGKQVDIEIFGRETLIDKAVLDELNTPMNHLITNAIAHGIEDPATRQAGGKVARGKITIRAYHQGNQTVISINDDGGGINAERVKQTAINKGLLAQPDATKMSESEIYDLLFEPGFSTKTQADQRSGRGMGLDIVKNDLADIRGTIHTESAISKGTTFTIRLPLTLSISKAMFCVSDRTRIAFPVDGFEDVLEIPQSQVQLNSKGQPCIQWRDMVLPFQPLANLLVYNRHIGRGNIYGKQDDDTVSLIILRNEGTYLALQVDQFQGESEIVIKQLEGPIPKPAGIAGATVLGDGRVMAIANVLELFDIASGRLRPTISASSGTPFPEEKAQADPTVLIVDDSITVRELLSLTFAKVGYRVEQARDGQDAWEKLRAGLPCDLIFCDIEMPRMDGLELLSRLKKDESLSKIPIAMLTSRGADRHRQTAVQLGASGYFTKPYLEEELLTASQRMLKGEVLVTLN